MTGRDAVVISRDERERRARATGRSVSYCDCRRKPALRHCGRCARLPPAREKRLRRDAGLQNLAERVAIRRSPLVVTAGGDGLSTFDQSGRTLKLPGIKIVVESTHGAGDAFVGTLAARIVSAIRSTSLCRSRIEKRQNWCRRLSKCRRLEERCMLRALRCGMWRLPRRSMPARR